MKTDELIDQLAAELNAVQPLNPPLQRACWWMLGSFLYLTAMAFFVTRFGIGEVGVSPGLLVSQLIGVVAGIAAAVAAFATVVPGYSRRILIWPAVAVALWLVVFVASAINGNSGADIAASTHEWVCIGLIVIGGLPLIAALATMLRRGAPMSPRLSGLLGAIAVGLFANFSACVLLPHASFLVTLSWHGAALAFLALIGFVGSRFVLSWDTSSEKT